VACVGGTALSPTLRDDLAAYLDARRSPQHRLRIRDYQPFPVRLEVDVGVLPSFVRQETILRVRAALGAEATSDGAEGYFSFARRELGEDLFLSDVYALVEGVAGVDYVVATSFRPEAAAAAAPAVLDRVDVSADAVATGGDASDPAVGVLVVRGQGGIA
jgi:hypothetical protein